MAKGRNSIIISGILAAFVTGLIITVSSADAGGAPPSGPDAGDFACYSKLVPVNIGSVILNDQFGESQPDVGQFLGICASGNKEFAGGFFPSPFGFGHHMTRYAISGPSPDVRVELTDQFGTTRHNVLDARELFLPAVKLNDFPPLLDVHWKCYDIEGEPISESILWEDQFGGIVFSDLLPRLLCAPATKILLGGTEFPPQEGFENTHLKCYNIDRIFVTISSSFSDQFLPRLPIQSADSEKLCTTVIKTVLPKPCVKFTVKGEDIPGSEQCNLEAFDLWVKFRGPATMQFTKDGDDVGLPMPKPKGTNDFHVEWDSLTCEFLIPPGLVWTKNGVEVATTTIPAGANDFDFDAKKIAQVMWGFPDESMADVPIPKGHVTDIHFDCVFPGGSGDPT